MERKQKDKSNKQAGGFTHKKDMNAGSGAFNQGSEQDPDYNNGVADDPDKPRRVIKKKENPKDGNIGKNNAGGYK
jgi:hypothetical protein